MSLTLPLQFSFQCARSACADCDYFYNWQISCLNGGPATYCNERNAVSKQLHNFVHIVRSIYLLQQMNKLTASSVG